MAHSGEMRCTYGSKQTPDTLYYVRDRGGYWYVIDGSVNVNFIPDDLPDMPQPVYVETLEDTDMFTAAAPITSVEELEAAVED